MANYWQTQLPTMMTKYNLFRFTSITKKKRWKKVVNPYLWGGHKVQIDGTHNLGSFMDMGTKLFLSELVKVVFLFPILPTHCLVLGLKPQKVTVSRVVMYELHVCM